MERNRQLDRLYATRPTERLLAEQLLRAQATARVTEQAAAVRSDATSVLSQPASAEPAATSQ